MSVTMLMIVCLLMPMRVFMCVIVAVFVTVLVFVPFVPFVPFVSFVSFVSFVVKVVMIITVLVPMPMPASVFVFSFLCHFPIPFSLLLPSAYFSRRLIRLWRSLLPFPLTPYSLHLTPHFFFPIPSMISHCSSLTFMMDSRELRTKSKVFSLG